VNTVRLDVEHGRTTRINRLSLDGVTNITNDATWLDEVVDRLFDITNLPPAFMPGPGIPEGHQQEVIRYFVISGTADYWPVHGNSTEEEAGAGDNNGNGMETADDDAQRPAEDGANPAAVNANGQPSIVPAV
jgi:hypothetical protein